MNAKMCDFDNEKCCGECFNQREADRVCLVCETKLDDDERTEHRTCDICKLSGCQHIITSYEDEDYEHERFYCVDCAADRRKQGNLDAI